jgi:flagellar hook-associated protein 3 FlgL
MRVTANTFPNSLLNQLRSLGQRQTKLQNQAATGQMVTNPEDDPVAMRRVLDMQAENGATAQYQRNIGRHQELAGATFGAIKSLKSISDRAREISIAADKLKSPEELTIYAKEVTELIKQAVQIANTKNRGDYLFAGTLADQKPFIATLDSTGAVTAVAYQGNTTLPESEIASGITLTTQVPGANTTGTGARGLLQDTRAGADFLGHLIDLQNHLLAADVASIEATDRTALGRDEDNFLYQVGTNGAIQSRLESTNSLAGQRMDTLEKLVSKEVDADLTETIVRLTQTQTAYQAALQSAGRILGSSLLDYLR